MLVLHCCNYVPVYIAMYSVRNMCTALNLCVCSFDVLQFFNCRFLPAIMQHRRAASDTTAFLFKGGLADLLNESPAGDHSSPSITPMLSHLNKSTGRRLSYTFSGST